MTEEKKGMLAAGLAYCIFGTTYLFSKIALGITEPAILLCVRFTITFAVLNLLVLTRAAKVNFRGKKVWGPWCWVCCSRCCTSCWKITD